MRRICIQFLNFSSAEHMIDLKLCKHVVLSKKNCLSQGEKDPMDERSYCLLLYELSVESFVRKTIFPA